MTANPAAYAALGLKPGADRESIEKAYRRLIKRYHPDRAGGDAARAAEINRAYFELRDRPVQEVPQHDPADIAEAIYRRRANRQRVVRAPRRRIPWKPIVLLLLLIAASAWRGELGAAWMRFSDQLDEALSPNQSYRGPTAALEGPDPLESAIDSAAVDASIGQAQSLAGDRRMARAADISRLCHRTMRSAPSAEQLDRCAAFDFTMVALSRGDLFHDEGPFSASAVTAREMSAARLLSDDYMLIEARFDRIRARVDAAVAPEPLPPAPPLANAVDGEAAPTDVPPVGNQTARTDLPARVPD
jgi:curved DNA-binding protein CbpA